LVSPSEGSERALVHVKLNDIHPDVFNPLNAELNPIRHYLALLEAHHILHVSRRRVKDKIQGLQGV
jgi:hypothetical protein